MCFSPPALIPWFLSPAITVMVCEDWFINRLCLLIPKLISKLFKQQCADISTDINICRYKFTSVYADLSVNCLAVIDNEWIYSI